MQDNLSFIHRLPAKGWLLSIVLCVLFLVGCDLNTKKQTSVNSETEQSTESNADEVGDNGLKAPEITADAEGLIGLNQCLTNNDRLRVVLSKEQDTVSIYIDDELTQTITDSEDGLVGAGGDIPVFFMDANFDGFTDIFIGPGESRTYSTLLIWEPTSRQFKRIGKLGSPSLQNILLCPETKSVFEGGSNSWCNSSFTRSEWENGILKVKEEVNVVTDPEQYAENNVCDKYTLKSSDGKTILSCGAPSQLPGKWNSVMSRIGF